MKHVAAIMVILVAMPGCALFTKPLERPVIEEKLNPAWGSPATVGTLSLTPERRVVLVNFRNNRFCAEAPTEIGVDLSSLLNAKLTGGQAGAVNVDGGITTTVSSQNMALNKRTQGMQLFLANAYFTCQMYMNGGIDERQLLEMQFQTLKIVEPLISAELSYMYLQHGGKDEGAKPKSAGASSNAIKKDVSDTVTEILNQKSAKPDESPKPQEAPRAPKPN